MKAACPVTWLPLLFVGMTTQAQPLVYQATGNREQVQAVVAQFEHDIVYGATGDAQNPPLNLGSYRVAAFDDIAPTGAANSITSGGLTFRGSGGGSKLWVIDNDGAMFSPPNGLAFTTGSTMGNSDVALVSAPDATERYSQNAFGAVFANVPSGVAALDGFLQSGSRFHFDAQPTVTPGQFSFIGVIDPQELLVGTSVIMNATPSFYGFTPPGPDAGVVDQIILGAAVPLPEPRSLNLLMIAGVAGGTSWLARRARVRVTNG